MPTIWLAQSTRWNELTNNKGAGLFGSGSEGFLRSLYDAESFFIRLTDGKANATMQNLILQEFKKRLKPWLAPAGGRR